MKNTYGRLPVITLLLVCISTSLQGAEIRWVPIESDGQHGIIGQEIRLVGGGQRVVLELMISGWDPNLNGNPTLRGYQISLNSCGYGNNGSVCNGGSSDGSCCITNSQCPSGGVCVDPGVTLAPAFKACTTDSECATTLSAGSTCRRICIGGNNNGTLCSVNEDCPGGGVCSDQFCRPGYVDSDRPDFIFTGITSQIADVATSTLNYVYGGGLFFDAITDNGTEYYVGTLVLDVPINAFGSYTIGFFTESIKTFIQDSQSANIMPLDLIPAIITVVCESNADCDDNNLCTTDTCNIDGLCSNTNNFNDVVSCCNPANGVLTNLDDSNTCTDDVCNPDGTVNHPPLAEFTGCGNPADTECDKSDSCDGAGNCLARLEPVTTTCGDPTVTECNGADVCDGNGNCQNNLIAENTPCGDPGDTFCDNPDLCDAVGNCQTNHEIDGLSCDDGLFCTVDDACLSGACVDNNPKECDDGLPCTTDVCNDGTDQCDNTLNVDVCLIAGTCYANGDLNPANDCHDCDPISSTSDWTPLVNGSSCDDGDPCSGTGREGIGFDTCTAGVCAGVNDPECNDDCDFAIEALQGTTFSNNSGAGPDDGEASCQTDSNNDIWFIYHAPCDATVFVSTSGTVLAPSNDPVLNVFDACPGSGGVEIACDDDSGVELQSALTFNATGGSSYLIRVAGFENNAGSVALNIDLVNDCLISGACFAAGTLNPDNECEECVPALSTTTWISRSEGSTCGSTAETECDNPDACNGAGVCETNFKPDGTLCSDEGNECTRNFCNGGNCVHPPEDAGFVCGDPTDTECDNPDSCDGNSVCLDNFEEFGFACGDTTATECDLADICDGGGECTDNLTPNGTNCDDQDVCTGNDVCETGFCVGTAIPVAPLVEEFGPRIIKVTPLPAGAPSPVALRLTSPDWPCLDTFIQADGTLDINPVFQLPDTWGTLQVKDPDIVPDTTYVVEALCGAYTSDAGSGMTNKWGDVDSNGITDVADILHVVDGWLGLFNIPKEVLDLTPCIPDQIIDIRDILAAVDAWLGVPYPCAIPCP